MKRRFKGIPVAAALLVLPVLFALLGCGTEQSGTNGASEEYLPTTVGQKWVYDTYNVTRDPARSKPFYTHVSVESIAAYPGAPVEPILVTKYAARPDGERLRLNQADYWVQKDIFFKYEYFTFTGSRFILRGYNYLSEYRDLVIGTYFYDSAGNKSPFTLYMTPFTLGQTWDVLNYTNPDPTNNPTVFTNVGQDNYFGLHRDLDNDGIIDTMDISMVGTVAGRDLIETDLQTLNCFRIELTQTLTFHLSDQGDVQDISTTTYWIAPYYGVTKVVFYDGSQYLDRIDMDLKTWWFFE